MSDGTILSREQVLIARIREMEAELEVVDDTIQLSNGKAFAAGVEAAVVETANLEGFLRFQYDDAEPSRKAMWKEIADVVGNLKDDIAALSPTPGMVMVPAEKLQRIIDHTVNPAPTTMSDRKVLDWVNGQVRALISAKEPPHD
jgi:hypothetical protein